MIVLYGWHRWFPKRVAYRNAYCKTCDAPRIVEQYRTFNFFHIFFVPLLPLGVYRRWRCLTWGKDPHGNVKTPKGKKLLAVVLLVPFFLSTFMADEKDDRLTILGIRAVIAAIAGVILWSYFRDPGDKALEARMSAVPPLTDPLCIYCRQPLHSGTSWHCSGCGVTRL